MTAPLTHKMTFRGDTLAELHENIAAFLRARNFRVDHDDAPMITIASLCALLDRRAASVSRSLRRASCPTFFALYGSGAVRRRILKIRPTPDLLAFLKTDL